MKEYPEYTDSKLHYLIYMKKDSENLQNIMKLLHEIEYIAGDAP